MNRRIFISRAAPLAFAPTSFGVAASSVSKNSETDPIGSYGPFLSRKVFTSPVIIESLDLFERDGTWFVRARSTDGAEGWAVSHDSKMPLYFPIFLKVIAPHMVGKDARDIDRLVDTVFLTGANYKMQGQPFWVPIASAEFAILDLLGRIANQPVGELLGGIRRKQIPLYIANNHRTHGPEESLKRIVES
ncbi:MAG: L-alanine-DL-glutamate epimerase-like enolase superfamily enzyme, partial [Candidatus Pelagisphaera sp.]